jgi:hypothetical protein
MPAEVQGAIALRKALKQFTPNLAKETQKELGILMKPVVSKARGFISSNAPLSGWGRTPITGKFPQFNANVAKRGIGYKTTPSKPNRQGFRALARIVNASAAGAIYETAGRKNPNGRGQAPMMPVLRRSQSNYGKSIRSGNKSQSMSNNPEAGSLFIQALNQGSPIADANNQTGAGRRTGKMRGRAIFRAWKEDGGKTNGAVLKAIENSKKKFYAAMGVK